MCVFADEQESTKWIPLEKGVELEVSISHGNHHNALPGSNKKNRHSLFDSFRLPKSLKPKNH